MLNKIINIIKILLLVFLPFMLIATIICFAQKNFGEGVKGLLYSSLVVGIYFALRYFFPKQTYSSYTSQTQPYWRCPNCSTVLIKNTQDQEYAQLLGTANIVGTVTCGECQTSYSRHDVYGGKYDVSY